MMYELSKLHDLYNVNSKRIIISVSATINRTILIEHIAAELQLKTKSTGFIVDNEDYKLNMQLKGFFALNVNKPGSLYDNIISMINEYCRNDVVIPDLFIMVIDNITSDIIYKLKEFPFNVILIYDYWLSDLYINPDIEIVGDTTCGNAFRLIADDLRLNHRLTKTKLLDFKNIAEGRTKNKSLITDDEDLYNKYFKMSRKLKLINSSILEGFECIPNRDFRTYHTFKIDLYKGLTIDTKIILEDNLFLGAYKATATIPSLYKYAPIMYDVPFITDTRLIDKEKYPWGAVTVLSGTSTLLRNGFPLTLILDPTIKITKQSNLIKTLYRALIQVRPGKKTVNCYIDLYRLSEELKNL